MTRKTIRDLILSNTGRDDKQSVADAAIDLCMSRLGQLHDWQQTSTAATLPIGAGDTSIILPANTQRIIELRLINGLASFPMRLLEKRQVLDVYSNPSALPQNIPCYCYRQTDSNNNDTLVFFPISNGNYSIELTIAANPSVGSEDTAEPDVPNLDEAIVAYGTAYVFRSIEMFENASPWDQQFAGLAATAIAADQRRPGEILILQQHGSVGGRVLEFDGMPSGNPQLDPFVMNWPQR